MSIPTGQFCGGGELVYKYFEVVERKKSEKRGEEEEITVIVNCAGRTRSIVGTQSLVNALKEERKEGGEESGDERRKMNVFACENGTMGWVLAGLELEHQQKRTTPPPSKENLFLSQKAVERVVERFGVKRCEWEDVLRWKEEQGNGSGPSLFLFDVRLEDEFEKGLSLFFFLCFVCFLYFFFCGVLLYLTSEALSVGFFFSHSTPLSPHSFLLLRTPPRISSRTRRTARSSL